MSVKIIFEDNHLLILDKPFGLPTQAHEGFATSLEEEAKAFIKERDQKQGNVFLHAIFRLDTNASGIVVFAKSQKALSRLSTALKNHEFRKEYVAIVEHPLTPGEYECYLMHGDHKAEVVGPKHPGAKLAKLIVVSSDAIDAHRYRLKIVLLTGRYHQIRAQLAHVGSPIIGDRKYGSLVHLEGNQIELRHANLQFTHPTTKESISISSN